jgi:branched-subunit amino acid ABC-type transport system permease component
LSLTVAGIATYGCIYALTAMGLVVTYTTSGIFNFAQGAIGMIGAFVYWQFAVHFGWPSWAAFVFVVFIVTPALGAGIERVVVRRLENAGLEAKLTVTVALLLLGIAVATIAWNPAVSRTIPQFFNGNQVTVGGVVLLPQNRASLARRVRVRAPRLVGLKESLLATLAFAVGMDSAFFNSINVFGASLSLQVARPHIPGISFRDNAAYLILLSVVFAAVAVGLLALRRSSFGRRLLAINDSPSACLTLGIDMTRTKLAVFMLSAGLAGLGGALYGGAQGAVAPNGHGPPAGAGPGPGLRTQGAAPRRTVLRPQRVGGRRARPAAG